METMRTLVVLLAVLPSLGLAQQYIVFTDGTAIYQADTLGSGSLTVLRRAVTNPNTEVYYGHPFIAGKRLWYDRTETRRSSSHGQRLFVGKLNAKSGKQMTDDPWGHSSDTQPVASAFHMACAYDTNRTGSFLLSYAPAGRQSEGYGHPLGRGAACWGLTVEDKDTLYFARAGAQGILRFDRSAADPYDEMGLYLPYREDGGLNVTPYRLSMDLHGNLLIAAYAGTYYLVPGHDAVAIGIPGGEGFLNRAGDKVVYVTYEAGGDPQDAGQTTYRIFAADLGPDGTVSGIREVISGNHGPSCSGCWPSWVE